MRGDKQVRVEKEESGTRGWMKKGVEVKRAAARRNNTEKPRERARDTETE